MTSLKDRFGTLRRQQAGVSPGPQGRRGLEGRHCALVTGGSQGLGRALAEECARRGADLLLVALPGSGLPQAAAETAERYGVRVEWLESDLTLPGSPEALHQWANASGMAVSMLINNAGVGYNSTFEASTLRENELCILLNNLALVQITRLMLPDLRRRPQAFVLNVASLAAYFPLPYMPVYAPSKSFILSFSLALRQELRATAVGVSVLCPNGIRTNASCREKIEASGLAARLTCLDADQVAACAVRGMLGRRAVIVPGPINQAIAAAGRFVPLSTVYAIGAAFWGQPAPRAIPAEPRLGRV